MHVADDGCGIDALPTGALGRPSVEHSRAVTTGDQGRPRRDLEAMHCGFDIGRDGVMTQRESLADLVIRLARGDERGDLDLAHGEVLGATATTGFNSHWRQPP